MNSPGSPFVPPHRNWLRKLADATTGIVQAVRGEESFLIHVPAAVAVIVAALLLQATLTQWCLLVLCISTVVAAELFNSALERLTRAIDDQYNDHIRVALNIASGAVLITSFGAAVVGAIVFLSLVFSR